MFRNLYKFTLIHSSKKNGGFNPKLYFKVLKSILITAFTIYYLILCINFIAFVWLIYIIFNP